MMSIFNSNSLPIQQFPKTFQCMQKKTLKKLIASPFNDTPKCEIDFSFILTPSFKR